MDLYIVLKVLGIYMIVSGFVLTFKGRTVPVLLKDFFDHRAVMWLAGLLLILLGGSIVFGSAVTPTWVTFVGWLVLLKGVAYIAVPETFKRIALSYSRSTLSTLGTVVIVIGALLLTY